MENQLEDRNKTAISNLNGLIEICNDGNYGYKTVAEHVEDSTLKALFTSYAEQRAEYAAELQSLVRQLGGDENHGGDIQGALHRTWINVKNAFSNHESKAMLEEAVTGDEAAIRSYTDALQDADMDATSNVYGTLTRQLAGIQEAYDNVRMHRDRLASAA
jgi:uncharacterized protein (TIGR02284 family)